MSSRPAARPPDPSQRVRVTVRSFAAHSHPRADQPLLPVTSSAHCSCPESPENSKPITPEATARDTKRSRPAAVGRVSARGVVQSPLPGHSGPDSEAPIQSLLRAVCLFFLIPMMAFPARVSVCEFVSPSPVSGPIARADHPSAASPLPAGVVSSPSPSRQLPSTPVTDTTTTLQELLRSEETIPANSDGLTSESSAAAVGLPPAAYPPRPVHPGVAETPEAVHFPLA